GEQPRDQDHPPERTGVGDLGAALEVPVPGDRHEQVGQRQQDQRGHGASARAQGRRASAKARQQCRAARYATGDLQQRQASASYPSLLPTADYLMPTAYCLLPAACCLISRGPASPAPNRPTGVSVSCPPRSPAASTTTRRARRSTSSSSAAAAI